MMSMRHLALSPVGLLPPMTYMCRIQVSFVWPLPPMMSMSHVTISFGRPLPPMMSIYRRIIKSLGQRQGGKGGRARDGLTAGPRARSRDLV
jgi:hypothetical protein